MTNPRRSGGKTKRTTRPGDCPLALRPGRVQDPSVTEALHVVAMHGWAGDARCWEKWQSETAALGWRWRRGERGYGEFAPRRPRWDAAAAGPGLRVAIGHSLGPHLIPADVLGRADAVVLLAGFGAFAPPGRAGRRTRAALAGMAACLDEEGRARAMLGNFLQKVAEPQSADLLPPGPLAGPLDATNRARLRGDLELLGLCHGLPEGFPHGARILIVEAGEDRIVEPAARAMLRAALPAAEVITLPRAGHALLADDVIARVVDRVETWRVSAARARR